MVKGHGVASCYDEHVRLVRDGLGEKFAVKSGVIDFGSADWAAIAAAPAGGDGHGSGAAGGDGHGSESPCGYACGAAHPLREWAAAPLESLARYSARLLERAHAGFAEQPAAINHYHTVDPHFFLHRQIVGKRAVSVCYVHFLPETVDDSLQIPPMLRQLFYKYLIAFYRSMDYLVVVNPVFAQRLAGYGIDPARVKYIPNYVASEGFSPMAPGEIAQFREGLGLGGGRFTVLGVGQLQRRTGVADFVSAARALPGVQFLWAGGFSFGKLSPATTRSRPCSAPCRRTSASLDSSSARE
jgi:glycosyltransferase involved in cell wall biosynthesis